MDDAALARTRERIDAVYAARDHERYEHRAWAWFKAEIVAALGEERAAALWAEYARLAKIDRYQADVTRARNLVRYYERALASHREANNAHQAERAEERLATARARLDRAAARVAKVMNGEEPTT